MKNIYFTVFIFVFILALNACDKGDAGDVETGNASVTPEASQEFQPVDISSGGWSIIIEKYIREASMKNAATILGYSNTSTTEYVQQAPEGKEYFLIKLNISKEDSEENFEWDKLELRDQNDKVYKRIDDIFIQDLGMKRMRGMDLNFGSNEGWIAYEVDKESEGFTLQYRFQDDIAEYSFE